MSIRENVLIVENEKMFSQFFIQLNFKERIKIKDWDKFSEDLFREFDKLYSEEYTYLSAAKINANLLTNIATNLAGGNSILIHIDSGVPANNDYVIRFLEKALDAMEKKYEFTLCAPLFDKEERCIVRREDY